MAQEKLGSAFPAGSAENLVAQNIGREIADFTASFLKKPPLERALCVWKALFPTKAAGGLAGFVVYMATEVLRKAPDGDATAVRVLFEAASAEALFLAQRSRRKVSPSRLRGDVSPAVVAFLRETGDPVSALTSPSVQSELKRLQEEGTKGDKKAKEALEEVGRVLAMTTRSARRQVEAIRQVDDAALLEAARHFSERLRKVDEQIRSGALAPLLWRSPPPRTAAATYSGGQTVDDLFRRTVDSVLYRIVTMKRRRGTCTLPSASALKSPLVLLSRGLHLTFDASGKRRPRRSWMRNWTRAGTPERERSENWEEKLI
ncbi:MAG: hypothetical protein IPP07_15025 [Holophagales bacterium]|nr:hypothetical protein [Holophagales bacterium]